MISDCGAKSAASRNKIQAALRRTQKWLKARPHIEWTSGFYQYANRLAHSYFLREIAGVNAVLISLYFVHDTTHKPTELNEWNVAIELQKKLMGLTEDVLQNFVIEIFLHTDKIKNRLTE